jgi:hypothetical protein
LLPEFPTVGTTGACGADDGAARPSAWAGTRAVGLRLPVAWERDPGGACGRRGTSGREMSGGVDEDGKQMSIGSGRSLQLLRMTMGKKVIS